MLVLPQIKTHRLKVVVYLASSSSPSFFLKAPNSIGAMVPQMVDFPKAATSVPAFLSSSIFSLIHSKVTFKPSANLTDGAQKFFHARTRCLSSASQAFRTGNCWGMSGLPANPRVIFSISFMETISSGLGLGLELKSHGQSQDTFDAHRRCT